MKQNKKGIITLIINLLAFPASYVEPKLAILFLFTITLLWAIPDKNIEKALRDQK